MGSGASVQNEIPKEWMDIFKAMKLKPREVQKLYNIYNTVDADRSGSIDVTELLMFMDIERSLFTQRIFEAFDKDHTHRVDFYEFVVSAWKFCALGKEATCVFAFDLYDLNADGKLTSADVVTMFRELLGAKALEQEAISRVLNKLMKEAAANEDCISVDFFRSFTNVHQALLLPVFGIQNMLRISTLGVAFWDRMSRRRIELRPGVMVPLSELMVLHAHRKLFGSIMENKHSMGRVSSMMRIVLDNTNNAVQHDTPPPSPKATQRSTKILNPFAGLKTAAAAPAAPVMVHGNFVTATPSSPTSSYRISVVGGGGVGAGLGGGGLGGVGYPATYSPHTPPPVAASSPRTVVAGGGSGSASTSPSQAHAHSKHHSHSHSPGPSPHGHGHSTHNGSHGEHHTHSTHSTHSTHGGHGASSERSAHLHSSHSTSSGHSHGHSNGHGHNHSERSDGHAHHSHHSHNKEHSPHDSHSHHSHHGSGSHHGHHHHVEHSSSRSHTEAGSTGSISINSTTGNGHSPHTKHHLTPAQLLQSHPHAKRTSTDKPPL